MDYAVGPTNGVSNSARDYSETTQSLRGTYEMTRHVRCSPMSRQSGAIIKRPTPIAIARASGGVRVSTSAEPAKRCAVKRASATARSAPKTPAAGSLGLPLRCQSRMAADGADIVSVHRRLRHCRHDFGQRFGRDFAPARIERGMRSAITSSRPRASLTHLRLWCLVTERERGYDVARGRIHAQPRSDAFCSRRAHGLRRQHGAAHVR